MKKERLIEKIKEEAKLTQTLETQAFLKFLLDNPNSKSFNDFNQEESIVDDYFNMLYENSFSIDGWIEDKEEAKLMQKYLDEIN